MKKKTSVGILAFFAVLLLGVAGVVSANGGFGNFGMGINSGNSTKMQEFRTQVHDSVITGDFSTWKSLMESEITQDNFDSMRERSQTMEEFRDKMESARDAGDYTLMQQLREEYNVNGKGQGMGPRNGI